MQTRTLLRLLCLTPLLAGALHAATVQAPLDVLGVTDKAYSSYSGSASFRVPSTNGYSYRVLFDGQLVPTDVTVPVTNMDYHEVSVWRTNLQTSTVTNRLVRFIVTTPGRGVTENGIPPQVPLPAIPSAAAELAGSHLRLLVPPEFPIGYEIPVVAWVVNAEEHAVRVNGALSAEGQSSITIKRGVGSGFLAATNPAGPLNYGPQIKGVQTNKTINLEASTSWAAVSGVLSGGTIWPADARINVTGHLSIPAGSTLTIGAGAIVRLNPGVNITNNGAITINGTVERPVVFMPNSRSQPWGGFFMRTATGSIDGTGVIFMASGADPNGGAGHRPEQCLFLVDSTPRITLTDSAAIYMAGQLGHAYNGGTFTYTRFLMQRCITGGEYTGASFRVNDSAFIECPDDSTNFVDGDNDGLYFVSGTHGFTNTLFGWTKDDGIDSGGSGYGPLRYQNCWFEATFHEGNSLSGYKDTRAWDTVYMDCGQGIEDGYNAPTGQVARCLFVGNKIGVRHGDNYDNIGNYDGRMTAVESVFLQNHHDVWGYNWHTGTGSGWTNAVGQMFIRTNWLTVADTSFPDNAVWSPAADFWRLTNWMTTPPEAAVGVGFAVRAVQFTLATLFDGVLVRLSHFSTNEVRVNYTFSNTGGPLASGSITFAPGETLKRIHPAGFDVSAQATVQLGLDSAVQGELTGLTNLTFAGSVPAPVLSIWGATNTLPGGRLPEGLLVKLSVASGLPASVDYAYVAGGSALASGTLTFAPGETVKWVDPTGVDATAFESIQFTLSNPSGAALSGLTNVLYGTPPAQVAFATGGSQIDLSAFTGGVPVGLNRAVAGGVSATFQCEGGGRVLTNGTITFTAGQTLQTLQFPSVNPALYSLLRVSLANAVNAQLVAPSNVFFLRLATAPSPVLVASNSMWRYLDTGGNAGTAWRNLDYDDSSWSNGVAQLGVGDNPRDETTLIRRLGTNGQSTITFYFRQKFVAANPALFTSLAMWLLRDDGGVAYLNGQEIWRSVNMPPAPTAITFQTTADYNGAATAENTVDTATLIATSLVAGTNVLAVEIHQHDSGSSDASFNFALTGLPTPTLPPVPVITEPTNGQAFAAGATVPVAVSAAAAYANVALYVDTAPVASLASPPYHFTLTSLAPGTHEIVALGTDGSGGDLVSAPVNILVSPPADTDSDGLPDQWETDHGLVVGVNDAGLDKDDDGFTNLAEFLAGTDPQDKASYLKVNSLASTGSGNSFFLELNAVAGKTYSVLYADVLPTNFWAKLQDLTAAATNRVVQVTNLNVLTPYRYYRIVTPAQ
ncbi:MAG: hypothetical protein HZA90_17785 [Verrucomicrobia bacterium]|nr:hypothetical protein [Verrucomicrobiota bacterium]